MITTLDSSQNLPITLEVAQNLSNVLDVIFEPNIKELNRVKPNEALKNLNDSLRVGTGGHWQKVKDLLLFPFDQLPYKAIECNNSLYLLCKENKDIFVYRAHKDTTVGGILKFGVIWSLVTDKRYFCEIIGCITKT